MILRQTRHYQPGTVLSSWESEITGHYGPSPCTGGGGQISYHLPVSIHSLAVAELLIRTIAETNMALWAMGRPGQYEK